MDGPGEEGEVGGEVGGESALADTCRDRGSVVAVDESGCGSV